MTTVPHLFRQLSRQTLVRPSKRTCIVLGVLTGLLLLTVPSRADVRKAAKEVIPATVCVEWQTTSGNGGKGNRARYFPWSPDSPGPRSTQGTPYSPEAPSVPGPPHAPDQSVPGSLYAPDSVSLSSGTIVSADGLIVTIGGGPREKGRCQVTLQDGRQLPAKLLVEDQRSTLRLLGVDAEDLPYVRLAEQNPEVGQEVAAVVCADPTKRSVSQGIISMAETWDPVSQTPLLSADIAVGNTSAGAPLVDVQGRLLGIVSARRRSDHGRDTLAIPAKYVVALLEARQGRSLVVLHTPLLGVELGGRSNEPRVRWVVPDSPAAKAGLREGDVIVAINSQEVSAAADVVAAIRQNTPGTKVTVRLKRDEKEESVEVVLGQMPASPEKLKPAAPEPRVQLVHPEQLRFLWTDQEGTIDWKGELSVDLEALDGPTKKALEYLRATQGANIERPTVRVSRADTDKKLDQLSKDVQSLRSLVQELTEELKKLQEQLKKNGSEEENP